MRESHPSRFVGALVVPMHADGLRSKRYDPVEEEEEAGTIASVSTESDDTVVTMVSGHRYKLVGRPAVAAGKKVRIMKIELEYFVR